MNISPRVHRLIVASGLLACFFIYLSFALPSFHKPLVADDAAVFAQQAQRLPNKDAVWHPPLYFDILRFLNKVFSLSKENLRLFGILCFGLNLVLIYFLIKEISKSWQAGLLGCLLFATHPLAIQGSLVLDIDNTILTVLSSLFVLYFIKFYQDRQFVHNCFMGLLFFVLLWTKFSLPLILITAVFLFSIFKSGPRSALVKVSLIAGLGAGLFLLVWGLYARTYNLPYFAVFARSLAVLNRGGRGVSLNWGQELLIRLVKVSLWLGPYLMLAWLLMLVLRIKDYLRNKSLQGQDFCLLYISLMFVSYIFVGGTSFGLAKYQYPILPILSVLIASFIFRLKWRFGWQDFIFYVIMGILFIYLIMFGVGDLIYSINYTLRKIAIFTPKEIPGFINNFTFRLALYFLPFIIGLLAACILKRKSGLLKISALLLVVLSSLANISLDITQAKAPYFTTYCYGRDIDEMRQMEIFFKHLKSEHPDGIIIAPEDVLYNAGIKLSGYTYVVLWNDREKFIQALRNERVICVAYGFTWNALYSYKTIFFEPAVKKLLQDDYSLLNFATFSVWLRK